MTDRRSLLSGGAALAALPLVPLRGAFGPMPKYVCACGRAFMGGYDNEPPGEPCPACPPAYYFPNEEELAELRESIDEREACMKRYGAPSLTLALAAAFEAQQAANSNTDVG